MGNGKIKREQIFNNTVWVGENDANIGIEVTVEAEYLTCPICAKKWLNVYVDGETVHGGEACWKPANSNQWYEGCIKCSTTITRR